MTTRKYLLLLLGVLFLAAVVEAKIVKGSDNALLYQIPKTKVAPVIDGKEDNVWKTLDWNMQRIYNVGDPPTATSGADSGQGLTGMSKAMWDGNNLYILFYSVDDAYLDLPANPNWNQDAIEIYIDGDNSKIKDGVAPDPGGGLAPDDFQFTISHWLKGNEAGHYYYAFGTVIDTSGIEYKLADVSSDGGGFQGWITEIKIPLRALNIETPAGQLIGWELQQDEGDAPATQRESMSKWWSNSNNSWTDASLWGTAVLSTREVDTVLEIKKLPASTTITVDGKMDATYTGANPITMNVFRVGDPPGTDIANLDPMFTGFITAYPAYDDQNFYIFMDVVDAELKNLPANANWNQDAVEIYFDGDNSKTKDGVAPDPGGGLALDDFQFTISNWLKGNEAGHYYYAFGTAVDTTGIQYKIADREARGNEGTLTEQGSGYNVELKIPLTALNINPATGTEIGFELQLDNANATATQREGMEKWWNASNSSWTDASLWGTARLGSVITSVKKDPTTAQVRNYTLSQNYPNPFNPSTKIDYNLAKSGFVKLSVYNLLGKEVATLVNGNQEAGLHTVRFDAANLSSGVYFYKLQAGNTVLTNKMVFLK